MFNKGFLCPNCGPVQESKSKSIAKVQHNCCKECDAIVKVWERPLNERAGRCNNCAGAHFGHRLENSYLIRICHNCNEEYNTDTRQVHKKGNEGLKWKD